MTISKNELQQIADTLPIGYYAKARVSLEIDDKADTSYFMPSTRQIFVSLKGVNTSLAQIKKPTAEEAEKAVRAHLYHELSHAILTPPELPAMDHINVFEDERIETLLDDYYLKVNFKENIKALCGFDGRPPQDDFQKFFYACRFRIGKQEWLDEVDEIIKEYATLNWNSELSMVYNYHRRINEFYKKIVNSSTSDQEWQQMIEEAMQREQSANQSAPDIPDSYSQSKQNTNEGEEAEGASANGQNQNGEGEGEEGEENQDTAYAHGGGKSDLIQKAMESAFSALRDDELYDALDFILQNFAKKNKGGSAMQTYSGVFNPRNCTRDDFRYFDRKATVNGQNSFGSLNLNLFIDNSGSFKPNAKKANQIIATLCELERKYPFFSVDFAFCGDEVVHVEKSKALLQANQGTSVQAEAVSIVKKMQKRNAYNYNIVLYDGWADCDDLKYPYEPWDMSNATLILDRGCKTSGGNKVKIAKVIYADNYLEELNRHIILTLQRAFR